MRKLSLLFIFLLSFSGCNAAHAAHLLPDEPASEPDLPAPSRSPESYNRALDAWKTAEDINRWVAVSFIYDKKRALGLSSHQKIKNNGLSIYDPAQFFKIKAGVCVDLARFGVETLKIIDPNSDPKYLMIEFDPIQINGNTFRLHWLVSFKKDGMKYFFCDSTRPGYIAGPYKSAQIFINAYKQYRNRGIVAHRELESYKKQKKSKPPKERVTKSRSRTNAVDR